MMRRFGFALAKPILHRLDPERAHDLTLAVLKRVPFRGKSPDARLRTRVFGLDFPSPLGLAAGFDKNAVAVPGLLAMGFGFIEVGSLTPLAQTGNPRPRLYRLPLDEAVINRFGFNNEGHAPALARLKALRGSGVIGVNVGANKDTLDKAADYAAGIKAFAGLASYFTLNISSPNTPGLRDLQRREALDALLARSIEARDTICPGTPVLVKIAPDLTETELDDVIAVAMARRVDGLIVGNTTLSRPETLRDSTRAKEAGGLSGKPLMALSTRILARAFLRLEGKLPLVGVGGVSSGEDALTKLRAGASLVQLYSGLVYQGPALIDDIGAALLAAGNWRAEIGRDAQDLA